MASNQWYVDPLNGDNANNGTSDATAWKTIQYALDNLTQNTADGDFVNVKSSATETLAANLDWTSIVQNISYPICIRGYDTTAGDGGYGVVDVNGFSFKTQGNFWQMQNMHIKNTGTAVFNGIDLGTRNSIKECKFSDYDTGGGNLIDCGNAVFPVTIENCEFTDINGICVDSTANKIVLNGNHFYNSGTKTITKCFTSNAGNQNCITNNIFNVSSTTNGVETTSTGTQGMHVENNTFFTTGTGNGLVSSHNNNGAIVENNIFEGWNKAVDFGNGLNRMGASISNNHFYDNITDVDTTTNQTFLIDTGNTYAAGESVLSKTGSNTHANRYEYFKPKGSALGGAIGGGRSLGAGLE